MNPRTDLLPVEQEDIDAAVLICRLTGWKNVAKRLEGGWMPERGTSEAEVLEVLAAHRLAHTPETQIGRDGLDHPNVLDEVANVKRELAERTRNMMGLLADLRASVDLDDDSSEGVLGYCDDLETAVHNIAAVASHLPGAAIPADPLRARLVEALKGLMDSTRGPKVGGGDGGTYVVYPPSAEAWNRAVALLAELTPESE